MDAHRGVAGDDREQGGAAAADGDVDDDPRPPRFLPGNGDVEDDAGFPFPRRAGPDGDHRGYPATERAPATAIFSEKGRNSERDWWIHGGR